MKRITAIIGVTLLSVCLCCGCSRESIPPSQTEMAVSSAQTTESEPSRTEPTPPAFWGKKEAIPEQVRQVMRGVSMPEGATVSFEDLAYLTISHYDYQGEIQEGTMVVDADLAEEILEIFEALFEMKFPIEKMKPVDYFTEYIDETFNNLDRASMGQNNTSSFYYRKVNGTNTMSYHAYGRAIDINPRTNPYYIPSSGYVSPANAYEFADRSKEHIGMIRHGDPVYQLFIDHGWEWGGDWENEKDYQHFQKP